MAGAKPITKQRSKWIEVKLDEAMLRSHGGNLRGFVRRVSDGELYVLVAEEPNGWHLTISFRDHRGALTRYPRWDEITHAREVLLDHGIDFVMHLPRLENYLACHDTTFHLHEHPPRE